MRAWQHLAPRVQRMAAARSARASLGLRYSSMLGGRVGMGRVRGFASAPTYPTHDEASMMANDDRHDRDASHLVCGKCSSPISKTQDLVFFKWRGGLHMSCMTEAPLQHLRTDSHLDSEESAWKKHKLHCIKCDHPVGAIGRVYSSDRILFKARDVAIQMPENQSPMLSLSGYPSSMLGFSMWSELLLMLESQPSLKSQLEIRRVDNIGDFSVEKKEINTMLLLASDLKALLDVVDEHIGAMNHVNVLTGLRRASLLVAAKKKSLPLATTPRFSVKSEAPEDSLMDFPMHILANPKAERAAADALNARLWKIVDAAEGLMTFGIGTVHNPLQLSSLASSLWRLNIGRPSILEPMALQTMRLAEDGNPALNAQTISLIASAAAHLSSKAIRAEPWMRDLLFVAAGVVLQDAPCFQQKEQFHDIVLPLARSMALTGHFHEEFDRNFFAAVNNGLIESKTGPSYSRSVFKSWQARIYQIHLDNQLTQRGVAFQVEDEQRLARYRAAFAENEKNQKHALFRSRHLVASALESMRLKPLTLHAFAASGYVVDIALLQEKIAIEINKEDAYLTLDPRHHQTHSETSTGFRHDDHTTLPFADLKAKHLEHSGWIVVQLPAEEFMTITDERERVEYLSMLIEMATYARAEALEEEFEDEPSRH